MTSNNRKKIKAFGYGRLTVLIAAICLATLLFLLLGRGHSSAAGYLSDNCLPEDIISPLDYNKYIDKGSIPNISAECAALTDGDGNLIFGRLQDKRMPMASTTKIMTALVVVESCPLDNRVIVDAAAVGIEGSSIYLFEGEELTVRELLLALLLESANDAAVALAIEVGGSVEGFASMMNQKAEALGLTNTHFVNPHGLDHEDHYTTAQELAIITAHALKHPILKEIFSMQRTTIPHNGSEGARLLINHNKLLRIYDGATGVKTGYTKRSGRCLVSSAERDSLTLIAVTLNAPRDWKDHSSLLDMGFDNFESTLLCKAGDITEPIYLSGGKEQYATAINMTEARAVLPKGKGDITSITELPTILFAPIEKGERLGRIVYYLDGVPIAYTELSAMYSVPESYKKSFFERLFDDITGIFK